MLGFTWRMARADEPSGLRISITPSSTIGFAPLVEASISGGEEACLGGKEFVYELIGGVAGYFPSELPCSVSKGEERFCRLGSLADSATCWSEIWMP